MTNTSTHIYIRASISSTKLIYEHRLNQEPVSYVPLRTNSRLCQDFPPLQPHLGRMCTKTIFSKLFVRFCHHSDVKVTNTIHKVPVNVRPGNCHVT